MLEPASHSIQLDRGGSANRAAGNQPEERTKAQSVPDAENNRVCHDPSQQTQRPVLPTQEVISKIKTPHNIQAAPRNADGRKRVVVHRKIVAP